MVAVYDDADTDAAMVVAVALYAGAAIVVAVSLYVVAHTDDDVDTDADVCSSIQPYLHKVCT